MHVVAAPVRMLCANCFWGVCYEWNYTDPGTKPVDTGTERWTIGAVCNWAKKLPEAEWRGRIDADRPRCELLCANCHHVHTHGERDYQ